MDKMNLKRLLTAGVQILGALLDAQAEEKIKNEKRRIEQRIAREIANA